MFIILKNISFVLKILFLLDFFLVPETVFGIIRDLLIPYYVGIEASAFLLLLGRPKWIVLEVNNQGLTKGVKMTNQNSLGTEDITINDLLEAGLHFGHQTKRWNPKMKRFVFDKRNGIFVIDLAKSLSQLKIARQFIYETIAQGKRVVFVGTKKISQEIINQTGENPFSLLLDSNRSPSDAHFRYFLALENKSPISIDESQVLFLICDQHSCPSLKDKVFIDSYCLPRCPDLQDEKQIILNDWQIKEKIKIQQTEIVKLIRI